MEFNKSENKLCIDIFLTKQKHELCKLCNKSIDTKKYFGVCK